MNFTIVLRRELTPFYVCIDSLTEQHRENPRNLLIPVLVSSRGSIPSELQMKCLFRYTSQNKSHQISKMICLD